MNRYISSKHFNLLGCGLAKKARRKESDYLVVELHDTCNAESKPDPQWVKISDAGEVAFRKHDAEAKV
jgi:hypothetical protein